MKLTQKFNRVFVDVMHKLYTVTEHPKSVYGESVIYNKERNLRMWDPTRSKLGAAIVKGVSELGFTVNSSILYLGCASGTTVSHVADIARDGVVFAVDFAPRVMRDLVYLAEERGNIIPIIADANHPENYSDVLKQVDFVFQDVAQKEQVKIFIKNVKMFLKPGKFCMLSLKARSIDVAKKPGIVFEEVRAILKNELKIIESKNLAPFEADHMIFLCKYE
ncbi:fibrillarin-like rRNA/tRNA 2'-O-methyltransferase [Candidatus Woesearchaeota archaeon]|nr:fibrillarin-like rRNA/tRNA 2'-O-methyltransferase [Candidatus Woesearchaeota archaeon]